MYTYTHETIIIIKIIDISNISINIFMSFVCVYTHAKNT